MAKKYWIIGLIILAIGGGSYMLLSPKKTAPPVETQTTTVRRGDIALSVSAAGTIVPKREVEVKSKASGTILKLHVRDGDWVKKGQLLVELDKTDEATKVRQAELERISAQARVTQATVRRDDAQRHHEQSKTLYKDAYISQDTLLKAASELNLAESELSISKATLLNTEEVLKNAKLRYADTEIRAPITGLVLSKWVEEGQLISSGISATTGGTPLMTIGDMSVVLSRAQIDEVDIGKVAVGQPATVQVDAYGEREFQGTLLHISPKGIDENNVTVFGIEIEIHDRKKDLLKAGMTNTAKIIIVKEENVLIVPAIAVHRDRSTPTEKNRKDKPITNLKTDRKPAYYVWRKQGETRTKQPVTIGVTDYENTQIIAGLKAGDTIEIPSLSRRDTDRRNPGQNRNNMRAMRSLGGR